MGETAELFGYRLAPQKCNDCGGYNTKMTAKEVAEGRGTYWTCTDCGLTWGPDCAPFRGVSAPEEA